MKQQLLSITLSTIFIANLPAQDCSLPAANICDSAKFICGYALNHYSGSNYGYQNWYFPDLSACGIQYHNPQYFKIVPCDQQLSLTVIANNCVTGDGLQVALAQSCDGPVINCDPGFAGGAFAPLNLNAYVEPGEPYILIIDGFVGDECEFTIENVQGLDTNPPFSVGIAQPGMITYQSLPCGPATLSVQLPTCQQNMPPGCSQGWADFYADNCLEVNWSLPPGTQIISPNPNAFTITVQFNQPVTNGMVSVSFAHTCPGINGGECTECIPGCCAQPIPPIFISNPGSSFTYIPCDEAPTYCAGSLDLVTLNNGCSFGGFGWWQAAQWNWNNGPCFSLENPNLFRVIACEGLSNFQVEVSNCENHRGLEFALLNGSGCNDLYYPGNCIAVPEGGSANLPLQYLPDEKYYLLVDGIDLDACDFKITEISNNGSNNGQSNCLASQPVIDNFSPFWPYYTVSFEVTHPNESVVTGGPGNYQFGYFMSAPIPCGTPYSFEVTTGGCTQIISGNAPCYLPPDCLNFNTPTPLADSCYLAPYISGGCLDGYCSTNAGLTPDQPVTATDTIPEFENNGWLRIAPCEDSIAIDFQVFDCQTGNELGFFLLSGDCDTMTLLNFVSAKEGEVAQLTASGLTPGEVYFLSIDGFYNSECKFQTHVLSGIGTGEPDSIICTNCIPSTISGPTDLCPADFATYTFHPGGCDISFVGGGGQYCPPPDLCKPDSLVLHWEVPSFMNYVSDSVGVYSITVQVDPGLIGFDTVLMGQVNAYWAPASAAPDTTSGGSNNEDNVICSCALISPDCNSPIIPLYVTVHHDVDIIYGELTCAEPCYFYNGQSYCSPGQYLGEQTNCYTIWLFIVENVTSPFANAGPDKQICEGQSTSIGGLPTGLYTYSWSNGAYSSQQTVAPAATTSYSLIVTNSLNGCTATDNVIVAVVPPEDETVNLFLTCNVSNVFFDGYTFSQPGNYTMPKQNGCGNYHFIITSDYQPPQVSIAPVPKICYGDDVTLVASSNTPFAQYVWSNNMTGAAITVMPPASTAYTVTVTNPANGCTGTATASVQVIPPLTTTLPPKTICEGDCVTIGGEVICPSSSGNYSVVAQSYQGCDSTIIVPINVEPYVVTEHGAVGTLTCDVTSVSFMGKTYSQPGAFTEPDPGGCGEHHFTIDQDVVLPSAFLSGTQQICLGETAVLTANSDIPNVQFTWDNDIVGPQIEVVPTTTTTYNVVAFNPDNGCTNASAITVVVNNPQTVQLGVVGTITCAEPCFTFNGQTYCQPGTYSFTDNCEIKEFEIAEDLNLPTVQLGIIGTITCAEPCFTFNGQTYCQPGTYSFTDNCEIKEFEIAEDLSLPTVQLGIIGTITCAEPCFTFNGQTYCQPGTYSFTDNCEIKEFEIAEDLSLPTLQLGVVGTITCAEPCFTFNGQTYCQPGTYSFTDNCEIKEFEIAEDLSLPTVQLGIIGTITCAEPCFTFNGQTYCQPGTYSFTDNCEIKEFEIAEDLNLPTVQLGIIGTITCAEPCFTFNGQTYCQPGTYSFTDNCEIKEFEIAEDLNLPTVQLGIIGTITCAEPCFTFNGQTYCQPGTYSFTDNCEIKEFEIAEDLNLPTVQLGIIGTITCAEPCFTFNGQTYCQPGTFSFTDNCEIKEFEIAEDLSLPTVQLGIIGTITCAEPCFIFNGQTYCQPGTFSFTDNCEIKEFEIVEDLSLQTVQLGVVGTLTCAEPCFTFNGQTYCQPGTYSFTDNCEIKEFEIADLPLVWLELGPDQTIAAGASTEITAQTNAQPAFISWNNSAGAMSETSLGITVQPAENTLYSLKIQDMNGCLLEDSVWVLVQKAEGSWFAPNVIRSGANDLNGWFTIFASPEYVDEISLLEIFDRWGNLVFTRKNFLPNDRGLGWDGTKNGKMTDPAVFVWQAVLLLKDGSTELVKGDVTVLR